MANEIQNDDIGDIIDSILERLENIEKKVFAPKGSQSFAVKRNPDKKSQGSVVWDAYQEAYVSKYGVKPLRNAMTNGQANSLVSRVGQSAPDLIRFYLTQRDSFYAQKLHPLGLCLKDAETLMARMAGVARVTPKTAMMIDDDQSNIEAAKAALMSKYEK